MSAGTGCVSIFVFASSACAPVRMASSVVGLKICAIAARIKKYMSIIKKKKKHDQMAFLGKTKLDTIEVLISKSLVNSYISHNEFALVNNALKEYNEMKEEINNPKSFMEHAI